MYCSHFGLQRLPFNNTPDPTFYYSTPDHEEALATLQYATQQRKGFVLVSGEIGAGKTLIGRIFLRQMDASTTSAVISQTNLTGRQLLAAICTEFGLAAPPEASNLELTQRLQDFLVEQFARNRFVVVLLDEAQNLPDESFEELRMLGNLEADDAKLLQVCILGQPELRERFSRPCMKQLEQRLFRRFHLPSLNQAQTGEYIIHRLGVAGCKDEQLFTPDAVERIFAASGGVPRLINQICDNALLTAYGQDEERVDGRLIDLVIERDHSLSVPSPGKAEGRSPDRAGAGVRPASAGNITLAPADTPDSVRLAELALEQTQQLCSEVAVLASGAEPLRGELDRISQRQGELHKIVAGATTRWLAAKEKLEEYRKEIQSEIREVIVRCHRTQERLQEIERTAAPAEDLEEIRENHLRETNRLLKLMQNQRDEFHGRLEDVQQQWAASEQELRRLAAQARADERFTALQEQCEHATREVVGTMDRHRQGMLEHLGALRQQCEIAHNQLHSVQAALDRRVTEADRRVEQLRTDCAAHEKELSVLREQLEGWRRTLQQGIEDLKLRVAAGADAENQQERRRELDALRREQSASAAELARRIEEQSTALQAFRNTLSEAAAQADLLHRQSVEQIGAQSRALEDGLEASRRELASARETLQGRLDGLQREWDQQLQQRDRAWQQQLDTRDERLESLEGRAETLGQNLGELARRLERERDALQAEDRNAGDELDAAREQLARLAEFRDQQAHATQLMLGQLQEQRGAMREQFDAFTARYRGLESDLEQLRGDAAARKELENVRHEHARQLHGLEAALNRQEQAIDLFTERMREQADALSARLGAVAQESASASDVAAIRDALLGQIEALSHELSERQAEWGRTLAESRERVDRIAAELAQLAGRAATRDELADVQNQHRRLATQIRREFDEHAQTNHEQLRQVEHQLAATEEQVGEQQARLEARLERTEGDRVRLEQKVGQVRDGATQEAARLEREIGAVRADLADTVHQVETQLGGVDARREEGDRELQDQIKTEQTRHAAAVADLNGRWEALRASLEQLARDTVPSETFNRVERALTADVSQLRDQLTDATTEQTQVLRTLVEKVQETAGRVSTLENAPPPHIMELQPEVFAGLGKLVETAQTERASLNETLERAGAISAHFRNCSSQVQEIMEHWMSSAGEVRSQSDGLRASAESARGILEAMRRCNGVLDAKLNSQRWRTQLERGESLTARLEQAVTKAQAVAHRLESLLADFDSARTDMDAWEERQRQADSSAARLAELLEQAQSRQQLLGAIARNTSQLVDVIQTARIEDELRRPTPPARGMPAAGGNGHAKNARSATRLEWPTVHPPAIPTR